MGLACLEGPGPSHNQTINYGPFIQGFLLLGEGGGGVGVSLWCFVYNRCVIGVIYVPWQSWLVMLVLIGLE